MECVDLCVLSVLSRSLGENSLDHCCTLFFLRRKKLWGVRSVPARSWARTLWMAFVLCFLWVRKKPRDVFSLPSRSQGENALNHFRTPVLGRRKLLRDVFSVFSRSCFPRSLLCSASCEK